MSIPTEVLTDVQDVANQQEMVIEESFQTLAPEGKFSKGALNRVVKELNKILERFGDSYPEFEEDQTIFPEEFVRYLGMISAAAADADAEFQPDFENVTDDRDLALLAGKLRKLGNDKTFIKFLESQTLMPEEEEVVVQEEVVEDIPVEMDEDIDEYFAGRI